MQMKETTQYEEQRDEAEYRLAREAEHASAKSDLLERLRFVREQYQNQIDGIPIRMEYMRGRMISSMIAVGIMLGVMALLVVIYSRFALGLIGVILGVPAWPFTFVVIARCITDIRAYRVHLETSSYMRYIERKKIFTLPAEKRYCTRKMIETDRLIRELTELKEGESYKKFLEWQYEERRADEKV